MRLYLAEGVRIELTSVVLETTVLAFERTLNMLVGIVGFEPTLEGFSYYSMLP